MNKTSVAATVSICISTILAIIFCLTNLCNMMGKCPKCAMQCMKKSMKCRRQADCKADKTACPRKFKMNKKRFERKPDFKAEGKKFDRKPDFKADKKQFNPGQKFQMNKNQQIARQPRFKITEEQKAQFKLYRETVEAYKKEQTPENKAKLTALLNKTLDKRIAMQEKRAESMKKAADDLAKKTADMKAKRDAEIEKMIQGIMNPPRRQFIKRAPRAPKAAAEKAAK